MKLLSKCFKNRHYLLRLLLTIAGIVCIPLVIMQFLMMEQSVQGYSTLNEEHIFVNLQESTDYFISQIEKMNHTAFKVSQNLTIRKSAKKNSSEYTVYEASLKMEEYNSDEWSVGIWFYSSNSILFNKVRIDPESLYEMLGGSNEQTRYAIKKFFDFGERVRIMSTSEFNNSGEAVVILAKPVSFLSVTEKDALVFFVMNQETIEQEFNSKFNDCAGTALMDSDGKFLVRNDFFSEKVYQSADFQEFITQKSQTSYKTISGSEYVYVYKYEDIANGYTCLVAIYEDDLEEHLRKYITNIRSILLTSIFLMLVLLALSVKINYKPIEKLTKEHGGKATSTELSEVELLNSAFFSLDQKILNQNNILNNFIISDLLSGRFVDEKRLEESTLGNNSCGSIVMVLNGPSITSIQSGKIVALMKEKFCCDAYITGITYYPQIVMVCILYEETDTKCIREHAEELLKCVTGNEYILYSGNIVKNVTDIRSSYLKILTKISENELIGSNRTVEDAIRKFGDSLHSEDAAKIQNLLDLVESCLLNMEESEELKNYYCYKLLLIYVINTKDYQWLKEEKLHLNVVDDIKQLIEMIRQSVRRICSMHDENEQTSANKLSRKLLNYVNDNFNDQELCLTSAADHIGTSIYVVSRLFKEVTGKGFKEYITDKRLEYARELFETTNYNVMEISAMAGFENTVYFSSVFKTKYGLPPSHYRKKH